MSPTITCCSIICAQLITGSPSLRVLDVSWNNIRDDGISLCLQHVNTLTELNVTGCELTAEGMRR